MVMSTSTEVMQVTTDVATKTTTALAVVTQSIAEINSFEAGIAELERKYGGLVFDVKTAKGMKEAKEARAKVREPRYALQNLEKAAKRPLNGLKDAITEQTAAMIDRVAAIENPLHEAIDNEEMRLHNEAVSKATAERERVEKLEARLEALQLMPFDAQGLTSAQSQACLDEARALKIGEDWQEFAEKAERAKVSVVAALEGMVAAASAKEAEAARIIAERAELDKLRAEAAARDIAERERQAVEAAKVAAEQKAKEEMLQAAHTELQRQQETARKAQEEEQRRLAAAQLALQQEREQLAKEQAERMRIDAVNFRAHQEKLTDWQRMDLHRDSNANPSADVYSLPIADIEVPPLTESITTLLQNPAEASGGTGHPSEGPVSVGFALQGKPVDEDAERAAFEAWWIADIFESTKQAALRAVLWRASRG